MMLCSSFSPHSPQLPASKLKKKMVSDEQFISNSEDEDYIDIEVSAYSIINSPPKTIDFEFQMSSITPLNKDSATSPADELFYKGKLLPLHLPPRLQMVRKLLRNSDAIPSIVTPPYTNNNNTPFESCNVSPRVSVELDPDEHFFKWSTELNGFVNDRPKHSWSMKLKLIRIKDSLLGQKLKASTSYIKSMFTKQTCNADPRNISKAKECFNKYISTGKRSPFVDIKSERCKLSDFVFRKDTVEDGGVNSSITQPRRSFSEAIKRCSAKKSSSSTNSSDSSSSSSSSFSFILNDLQLLRRSINADSDIEISVEGAIAHCKQTLQLLTSQKTVNDQESVMFPNILL